MSGERLPEATEGTLGTQSSTQRMKKTAARPAAADPVGRSGAPHAPLPCPTSTAAPPLRIRLRQDAAAAAGGHFGELGKHEAEGHRGESLSRKTLY